MSIDLTEAARERGIKFFLVSYTDLFGAQRAKLVPAAAIGEMVKEGAGFAGFATWLDLTPADTDLLAMPDPDSMIQLPWKPEVAWVAADLYMDGKPIEQGPRNALKRMIAKAAEQGYAAQDRRRVRVLPDFSRTENAISDPADTATKPCYDQQALMRRFDAIAEICDAMSALGWNPYQNDHEDANGQFEMNWEYRRCARHRRPPRLLQVHGAGDRREAWPARHLHAQALPPPDRQRLPRPCVALAGRPQPVRATQAGELGMSTLGYHFIGGLHECRPRRCARSPILPSIPTSASMPPHRFRRDLGAEHRDLHGQQPDPHDPRFPTAAASSSACRTVPSTHTCCRPRCWPPVSTASHNRRDPGKRLDINMYTDGHTVTDGKKLPLNLLDALRVLDQLRNPAQLAGRAT